MKILPGLTATSINEQEQIVGIAHFSEYSAFLWQNGSIINLDTAGHGQSLARSINDIGQVVGYNNDGAFVWDKSYGMQSLFSLIPANTGWSCLCDAYGINNLGQIVGIGKRSATGDQGVAFLLTPIPEPSSFVLFGMCIIMCLGHNIRKCVLKYHE